MKLSVIIVNYNVRYFLEQCLLSVNRALENTDGEVIVVDNASADDSVEMVRKRFPSVKLFVNESNLGFSQANNLGIRSASGEYILLLNPDTVVAEDTFSKCLEFMDAHADAGALGVHMVDGKGNFLPESKRGLPTPSVAFYKMFGLAALFPKSKTFGKYHLGFLPEDTTNEAEVLSGAFMFIRKAALDKAGLLDETFFMYGEDIDLSYRLIKAGYKNYYFADTTIIHYKGESTKKGSLNYVRVFYSAMLIFARKHFTGNQSGVMTLLINVAIFFRGLMTLVANLISSSYLFMIDALVAFAGIYYITVYWENTIKYSPDYYPVQFLSIVVPVYVLIWIVAVSLSGGYEKPFRVSHILRGVLAGTVAIAAVYAFLPNEWRFSRAIILLGAVWTSAEMLFIRSVYQLINYQSLFFDSEQNRRVLIAGADSETLRAEALLLSSGTGDELIRQSGKQDVKTLSSVLEVNEVVFCSSGWSFKEIIATIIASGNRLEYKIFNESSDAFIGSNSKNEQGEVYSDLSGFNLSRPSILRKKRIFDVLTCLAFIPLFPILIFMVDRTGRFLSNWFQVLIGAKTWVGYEPDDALPKIPKHIIAVTEQYGQEVSEPEILKSANRLYAKQYHTALDLKVLLRCYRKLGN